MSDGRIIIDTEIDNSGLESGLKKTTASAKSQAAKLAAEYKKQGMSASEAFKKAWSEIERDSEVQSSKTAKNWENSTGKINEIAKKGLKAVTGVITVAATTIGAMGTVAIKVGSDFEAGMSKVQAISGATGKELEALTEKAKEMGAKTKFSAGESAQAFQYMAMAGWKTGDMLNGIEGIMNLAAASGEDLAMVSDIVTDALTAFGLQAKDSAHFADVLAKASSNSNTNVGLMGYTFQYVAPVAGALGYSIEDCAVAIGLMANAGIKGEKSGTALRTLFTNLISPTDTVAGAMKRLGIETVNTDGTMKPLNELLLEMRGSFAGLTDEQKASEAAALAGKEAMSGLLAIVNASDEDFNNLTAAIADSNGAAEEMATIMQDNLAGKLEQLGGGLETLGLTAYEKFQGPMKEAIDTAIEAVDSLVSSLNDGELGESVDRIAEGFGNLAESVAEGAEIWLPKILDCLVWIMDNGEQVSGLILAIGSAWASWKVLSSLAAILPVVIGFVSTLFLELATAPTIMAGVSGAMAMLGGLVTVIIGLISALIAGIVYLWNTNDGFRDAIINAWNAIKDAGKAVWEWLVKFFTEDIPNAWQAMMDWFGSVGDWFVELWENIKQRFVDGWNSIVAFFTESIPAWWESVKQSFVDGWQAITNFFTETIPALIESIFNWFNELPYKIGYALGFALGTIIQWGIDTWNSFIETCTNIFNTVVEWFSQLPGKIAEFITTAYNNIVEWGTNTWNKFIETCTNIFNSVVEWFSKLPGKINEFITNAYNNIVNWGTNTYNSMVTAVSNSINAVIEWFSKLPGRIWEWLTNTISKLVTFKNEMKAKAREAGEQFLTTLVNKVKEIPGQIFECGKDIVRGLWNGITSMGSWIANKVSGFFSGIVNGAKKALGIHSPSRVFRDQVGKYMAQGVGVGFEDETENIKGDIQKNLSDLTAKMTATVNYETAKTSSAMTAGVTKSVSNNTVTNNNDNGVTLHIEKFENNTDDDVETLAEEIAFIIKNKGVWE